MVLDLRHLPGWESDRIRMVFLGEPDKLGVWDPHLGSFELHAQTVSGDVVVLRAAQSTAIRPFATRVLAWRCRREIQFGRLGALLALESEHCGPGEEFRKAFTMIDSRSTTLDKPLTAVSLHSAETDRMSPQERPMPDPDPGAGEALQCKPLDASAVRTR
jgi:hypothetical protein